MFGLAWFGKKTYFGRLSSFDVLIIPINTLGAGPEGMNLKMFLYFKA